MLPALPGIVLSLLRRHRQPPLARRDAQQLTARRAVVAGQAEEGAHHADAGPQPQAAVDQGLTVLVTIDARQDAAQCGVIHREARYHRSCAGQRVDIARSQPPQGTQLILTEAESQRTAHVALTKKPHDLAEQRLIQVGGRRAHDWASCCPCRCSRRRRISRTRRKKRSSTASSQALSVPSSRWVPSSAPHRVASAGYSGLSSPRRLASACQAKRARRSAASGSGLRSKPMPSSSAITTSLPPKPPQRAMTCTSSRIRIRSERGSSSTPSINQTSAMGGVVSPESTGAARGASCSKSKLGTPSSLARW